MAIASDTLKSERDALKERLREIEAEQRRIEGELKLVRQKELRTKREIEAVTTLLDLQESQQLQDSQKKS